jgi:hypothetical protein
MINKHLIFTLIYFLVLLTFHIIVRLNVNESFEYSHIFYIPIYMGLVGWGISSIREIIFKKDDDNN